MDDILREKASFYDRINGLLPLYETVKDLVIKIETFDEKEEVYVAPMNEMRSTLDHIFRAIKYSNNQTKCDEALIGAKEHLERAAYDSYDLLAKILGKQVKTKTAPYDLDALNASLPEYFHEIKPKIHEIQMKIISLRKIRDLRNETYLSTYDDMIIQLWNMNTLIDSRISSLVEYQEKKKREKKKERFWQYLIGPVIGFAFATIIALLTWFLTK